jgi:hypothetical protein|tara:strand:+ start:121 stop:429 length:309 start_codon:yes stop_codon:yes gene_type:complete
MKKITLLCLYLFAVNAYSMGDYELCKMLDDSGDPNGTIEYVGESYFEGKNSVREIAQASLAHSISLAVLDTELSRLAGGKGQFIPNCLKKLKERKDSMFRSD